MTRYQYVPNGNVTLETLTDAKGNLVRTTAKTYDGANRVLSETISDANGIVYSMAYTYDQNGNVLTATDGDGNVTVNTYSGDRLVSSTVGYGTPAAATTNYQFDAAGNQISVTDPDQNVTTFTYNANHQVVTMVTLLGTMTTVYDNAGNVISITDADNRQRLFEYDGNRLMTETWLNADGTVADVRNFTYDKNGNMLSAMNNAGTITMTYDGDRLKTKTGPDGLTLTYSYDAAMQVTGVSDSQGGSEQSVHDKAGNLTTRIESSGGTVLRFDMTYTGDNQIASIVRFVNGTAVGTTNESYNANDQVTSIVTVDQNNNTIADYGYRYDTAGLLQSQTEDGQSTNFGYDAQNQLIVAGNTGYQYDPAGNRTGGGYQVGKDNEMTADPNWTYSYDAVGDLTGKTAKDGSVSWVYAYNNVNQFVSATEKDQNGTVIASESYVYDALGDRFQIQVTQGGTTTTQMFAFDGQNVYADLSAAGAVQTWWVWGDQADQLLGRVNAGGQVSTTVTDYLRSVRVWVNGSGQVTDQIAFDAYGNKISESNPAAGSRYEFAGYQQDAISTLYVTWMRPYDPTTGRFDSPDAKALAGGIVSYVYVGNDPTNETDPTGLAGEVVAGHGGFNPYFVAWHHLATQEQRAIFKSKGIDVDAPENGWYLTNEDHAQLHSKLARKDGIAREWAAEVDKWTQANRNLPRKEFQEAWAAKRVEMQEQYNLVDGGGRVLRGKPVAEVDGMPYGTWEKGPDARAEFREEHGKLKGWNPTEAEKLRVKEDAIKFGRLQKVKSTVTGAFAGLTVLLTLEDALELTGHIKSPKDVREAEYYFIDKDTSVFVVETHIWPRSWFSNSKKIFVAGPRAGQMEEITSDDVNQLRVKAEKVYGWLEPGGIFGVTKFHPGTHRRTLPILDEHLGKIGYIDEEGSHYYPNGTSGGI